MLQRFYKVLGFMILHQLSELEKEQPQFNHHLVVSRGFWKPPPPRLLNIHFIEKYKEDFFFYNAYISLWFITECHIFNTRHIKVHQYPTELVLVSLQRSLAVLSGYASSKPYLCTSHDTSKSIS